MLDDQDKRVIPSAIDGLARLKAPELDAVLLAQLKNADFGIRAAAAQAIGELKPAGGRGRAPRGVPRGAGGFDATTCAQAALTALAAYGAGGGDRDAEGGARRQGLGAAAAARRRCCKTLDPSAETAQAIRPAPGAPIAPYDAPELVAPTVSPHAFIETAKGTIEIELTVLDAPQTAQNFIALARKGYFNGLQIHRVVPNFVCRRAIRAATARAVRATRFATS